MPRLLTPGLERRLGPRSRARSCSTASAAAATRPTPRITRSMPLGVVVPRTVAEAERAIAVARAEGVSACCRAAAAPRNAGRRSITSLVIDCSKHLTRILELDVAGRRCVVEPGIVLDDLNRAAEAARPVVSGRRLDRVARDDRRHGRQQFLRRPLAALRHHARQCHLDRRGARGRTRAHFGPVAADLSDMPAEFAAAAARPRSARASARARRTRSRRASRKCSAGSAATISMRCVPGRNDLNLAHILVGSEGTLAFSTEDRAEALAGARQARGRRLPFRQLLRGDGCRAAPRASSEPIAVELVDRTMIELAREIAMFRPTLEQFVRGAPDAVLLVEFGEDDRTRTCAA